MAKYNYSTCNTTINHHQKSEVRELRAPTDESVRLLREMEEKIREQIVGLIPIVDNNIKASLVIERPSLASKLGTSTVRVKYSLNNIIHDFAFTTSPFKKAEENLNNFIAAFGKSLVDDILRPVVKDMPDDQRKILVDAMGGRTIVN